MGGFAALLGHAAGGYAQAAQIDQQRQFEDTQARRAQMIGLLGKLAADETVHPEIRSWAMQTGLEGVHTPFDKKWEPDFKKMPVQPARPAQTTQLPGMSAPPAPPAGQPTITPGATTEQALPPGMSGPPQQMQAPPTLSMPPQPPPNIPIPPSSVTLAAQPQGGVFMSPAEVTALGAQRAGATAGAQLTGQIGAREQALKGMPEIPAELHAGLALGTPGLYSAMNRTVGAGAGYAKDLRAQGMPVPATIPDDQYVNVKELGGGRQTFIPAPAPGEKAGGGGTLITPTEQAQRNAATHYAIWQKQNATQFGQRQALLNQAFQLGVNRGYLGDANKAFVQSVQDYGSANKTMQSMDEAYRAAQENPNNQQAQVALLMAHIGMTLGVVKGARVGKAQIEEAEDSRTLFAGAASKLNFDKNGNLDWTDPIRKGVTLTPDQMKQMVDLGHQRMQILHQNIGVMHDALSPDQMGIQPIGTTLSEPPAPKSGGGKKKLSSPPSGNSIVDELIKKHG
jgi:hypothetical protein